MKKVDCQYIKSPLNYTGNKLRIFPQISKFFPKQIDCMIDLFCGGATVGINTNAKKIIFVDNNQFVINLLVYLSRINVDLFLRNCERLIKKYNLSCSYKYGYKIYRNQCKNKNDNNGLKDYNKKGFYILRKDYNSLKNKNTDEALTMLYLLMVYGFNNDLRFNSDGQFNLPVGKTDLNKNNVLKIKQYSEKIKKITAQFICADFRSENLIKLIKKADFIYMDPPYLLGDAVYNVGWNNDSEHSLLDLIDYLIKNKKSFALSNVISKKNKINEPLCYWSKKRSRYISIHHIKYNYRSASYNKIERDCEEKEILICNKNYIK